MLTIQNTIVTHEDDDRIVQLALLLQKAVQSPNAVIHREKSAPISPCHGFKVFYRFRRVVRKLFSPVEKRSVNAMPCVKSLLDPVRFILQHEGCFWIGDPNVLE